MGGGEGGAEFQGMALRLRRNRNHGISFLDLDLALWEDGGD